MPHFSALLHWGVNGGLDSIFLGIVELELDLPVRRQATGESMCIAVTTASVKILIMEVPDATLDLLGTAWTSFRLTLVIAAFSSLSNDIDIFGYEFVYLAVT
jgi:hypothetical protein